MNVSEIQQYIVVEPSDRQAISEQAFNAYAGETALRMVMQPVDAARTMLEITVSVDAIRRDRLDNIIITGMVEKTDRAIRVTVPEHDTDPTSAELVTE